MSKHTTKQAIKYYNKAREGNAKDYDKFIDYTGSLRRDQIIPIINRLVKTASRECLLDMLASALNYEENLCEALNEQRLIKRIGTIYHLPDFTLSRKLPSE